MSTRALTYDAQVLRRDRVSDHLVRLVLGGPGLAGFGSIGVPDEWVGLIPPGQFQSRYYSVRNWSDDQLTLDVVVHDVGLVTEWATGDCIGATCTITEPKGSFAMPAMARILETIDVPARVWAEVPSADAGLSSYLPGAEVSWLDQPGDGQSNLSSVVEDLVWPEGDGYFWMAGESAQMRAIRKHLMRDRRLPSTAYNVMGYWRRLQVAPGAVGESRAGDPGPIWRAGKAAGKTDEQIWSDYDDARDG